MDRDPLDIQKTIGREEKPSGYTLAVGQTLGQYRIIRTLGRGGMGEVYEAENAVSRKHYALKVLPRAVTASQNFVDRFRIESRVMSDLRHGHIVQVHHAGEENGIYYLTMDLVAGREGEPQTLEDLLAKGRMPEAEVKRLALQICDAVAFAHVKKVIHRDLKPSNVLIDAEGNAQVADFGLAKVVGPEYLQTVIQRSISLSMVEQSIGEAKTLPGSGGTGEASSSARALLGTYDYMAPEQKAGGEITARADVFALGVILYRMLTGEKPEGSYEKPSNFGASKAWDAIVEKCLKRNPEKRYADAGELKLAIEQVGRGIRPSHFLGWAAIISLLAGLAVVGMRMTGQHETSDKYLSMEKTTHDIEAGAKEQEALPAELPNAPPAIVVRLADIDESFVGSTITVAGKVLDLFAPPTDSKRPYGLKIADDSGEQTVIFWQMEYDQISNKESLNGAFIRARVSIASYKDKLQLKLASGADLEILDGPPAIVEPIIPANKMMTANSQHEPIPRDLSRPISVQTGCLSVSEVTAAQDGQTIVVRGRVESISAPKAGTKQPFVVVLTDDNASLRVIYFSPVDEVLAVKPFSGVLFEMEGVVSVYNGTPLLKVENGNKVKLVNAALTSALKPAPAADGTADWKIPGTESVVNGGAILVRFNDPVFVSAANISIEGMLALKAVAAKLVSMNTGARVIVTGFTDNEPLTKPTPQFKSNTDIAAARAKVAVDHLTLFASAGKGLVFEARTGESTQAPYPNDTPQNRRLNRTVTVQVVPIL